jgi:hypothetical protein
MSRKPQCPATCHGGLSAHPDAAHVPTEPGICDCYDRSRRSRLAIRRASCSRPRLDRGIYPVRHQGVGCQPLQAYRAIVDLAPNRADRRAVHGRCMPVPPWPTILGGDNWTMAGRQLSPYRSRASPRRKLQALINFARPSLSRARPSESQLLQCDLYWTSAANNSLK